MLTESSKDAIRALTRGATKFEEPLKNHTSFRIGGPADALIVPADAADLGNILAYANENGIRVEVIGNGTNLLVSDEGIDGIVVKIKGCFDSVIVSERGMTVGAGYLLSRLSRLAAKHGLTGLEFAVGIPGTIGGALVMNAGAHGGQMSDTVTRVTAMNSVGIVSTLAREELAYGYRKSNLQGLDLVVLEAEFETNRGNPTDILRNMTQFLEWRKQSQPLEFPNAGSIFRNPANDYAGKLIELSGCKGIRIGDAQVSDLHANFIINRGKATAWDVEALMAEVQRRVLETFGVALTPEVRVIGGKTQ